MLFVKSGDEAAPMRDGEMASLNCEGAHLRCGAWRMRKADNESKSFIPHRARAKS